MNHLRPSLARSRSFRPWLLAATTAAAALALPAAQASEQIFTHTYLSETNPAGAKEIEQWVTFREKKSEGTYRLWQSRTEFEYGVTDRWQLSLYANSYGVTAQNNNSVAARNDFTVGPGDGDEVTGGGPQTIGSYVPNSGKLPIPAARYHKSDFDTISVESIYQFTSPYKDGLGLAGYVEATGGSKSQELELKLLAQKNFLDDDLIIAANVAIEFERSRYSSLTAERETEVVISGGASYRVARGLRLALEMRNERGYEGAYSVSNSKRDYSAWFAGPTVHYTGKLADHGFSIAAGYSQQLPWARAYSASSQLELVDHRVYKETEKHVFRVIASVGF